MSAKKQRNTGDALMLKEYQNDPKAMSAIRRILDDRRSGKDYLLLPLNQYTIEDVYDALIEAGYRYSERYECWLFQRPLDL